MHIILVSLFITLDASLSYVDLTLALGSQMLISVSNANKDRIGLELNPFLKRNFFFLRSRWVTGHFYSDNRKDHESMKKKTHGKCVN